MEDQAQLAIPEDGPLGTFGAQVDDKGRLKLPSEFKEYLGCFGNRKVFITSLDNRTVRIYPISVWKHNLKVLQNYTDDPEAAANVAIIANANGAGCDMDDQGRVLLPQELRRKLGLENQAVRLDCYRGMITALGKEVFEDRLQRAEAALPDSLKAVRKRDFIG